ncbi:hypothetical protein E1263_27970 [Kribbella antibiotica]|uniref:Bacterial transcriptional activator domain-containing protein n=1 Tax=Kribbella antibiotica TaxID=190195 RepID=A0A4R4Z5P8_9ACTN|nr:BTAD domain-containing putative transcriptional regulator [Kribbella antibiotica]TDD53448.1 hypothetical protein E1263_27970 [Kribbella antibiotica]
MGAVEYELLGPLAVRRDGAAVPVGDRRRVLAQLLLHPNAPARVGGPRAHQFVDELRELLDPHRSPGADGALIELSDGRYMLCMERDELDLLRFEDTVARARKLRDRDRRDESAEAYRAALALWRGKPLAGLDGPPFDRARRRLEEQRLTVVDDLYEVELARGRHQEVLAELVALVAEFPLRLRLRADLMVALYRLGRKPQALAAYDELLTLGVRPPTALKVLRARIRRSDPLLMLPVAPPVAQPPEPLPEESAPEVLGKVVFTLVLTAFTCGAGAAVYLVARGIEQRRWSLLTAVGYAAAPILLVTSPLGGDEVFIAGPLVLLSVAHLLLELIAPPHGWWPRTWLPRNHRDRAAARMRKHWRRRAQHDPDAARLAGVGRPDLGRGTDDGGLVDVNSAPAEVLTTLPGVTPEVAGRILQERLENPFASVDELATRGVVAVAAELRGRVLTLPPDRLAP